MTLMRSVTSRDIKEEFQKHQLLMLRDIKVASEAEGIYFNVKFDDSIHDRRIETDHGWRIDLGKGLDIWQKPGDNPFDFGRNHQEFRLVRSDFSVHYMKISE